MPRRTRPNGGIQPEPRAAPSLHGRKTSTEHWTVVRITRSDQHLIRPCGTGRFRHRRRSNSALPRVVVCPDGHRQRRRRLGQRLRQRHDLQLPQLRRPGNCVAGRSPRRRRLLQLPRAVCEASGQGPATTGALQWTTGPSPVNQSSLRTGSRRDGPSRQRLGAAVGGMDTRSSSPSPSTSPGTTTVSTGSSPDPYSHTCTTTAPSRRVLRPTTCQPVLTMNGSGVHYRRRRWPDFRWHHHHVQRRFPQMPPPRLHRDRRPTHHQHHTTIDPERGRSPTAHLHHRPHHTDHSLRAPLAGPTGRRPVHAFRVPMEPDLFTGAVAAANGTLPNA